MHDMLILAAGAFLGVSLCTLAGAYNLLLGISPGGRERREQRQAQRDVVELLGQLREAVARQDIPATGPPRAAVEPILRVIEAVEA